jgi:predicted alpha/beta superfamily hydrolase
MRIITLLSLSLFYVSTCSTQLDKIQIENSEVRRIQSIMVEGQEYELQIILPSGYKKGISYPLIVLLDGQWDTPMVGGIYGQQNYDGFVPNAIIAGITWSGKNPNYDSLRKRDFVPEINEGSINGPADKFFNFIAYEAIPEIKKSHAIDETNISIMGSSLGGLFVMYAYFEKPQIFTSYICASPALQWSGGIISKHMERYNGFKKIKKKLYLTYGSEELDLNYFKEFVQKLDAKKFPNMILKTEVYENIGHAGTKAPTYLKGMQFTFEKPAYTLSQSRIKEISGKYHSIQLNYVELYKVLDQMYIRYKDQNIPLHASSDYELYSKSMNLSIKFFSNMMGFTLNTSGKMEMYKM